MFLYCRRASCSWQELPVKPQECKVLQQTWFSTRKLEVLFLSEEGGVVGSKYCIQME